MEFWALENADDDTLVFFSCIFIAFFAFAGIGAFVEWIKSKRK